jgi:putative PIN family toxin of toxin-antitoxin system
LHIHLVLRLGEHRLARQAGVDRRHIRRIPPRASDETFAELASRLSRPKFDRYVDQPTRQRFLADLAVVAGWVAITGAVRACRDPDDDKFLETAINGEAFCIVTGDGDLVALDPFEGVRIVTPRDFVEALRSPAGG